MFKRRWLALLLAAAPAILGGLALFLIQMRLRPIPILVFRMDVGTAALVTGLVLSALLAAVYLGIALRDRHARRTLETSLQEAERSRQRFLRRLDHEIKNPLTGLQAALTNLRETASSEDKERAARNADRAVQRLTRLLADLRKLSDLSERPVERLPVEIPRLLEEMIEAAHLQPAYGQRQINLTIARVPRHLPAVTGDRDLLGLAIYNLIENALKFTSAEDTVEVRALEDGRALIVDVADTGGGIPPDDLRNVFEELYRGTNARGVDGSGLGLALAQRIVDLHGGQLTVRSRQIEPRGTVFSVRLPIS